MISKVKLLTDIYRSFPDSGRFLSKEKLFNSEASYDEVKFYYKKTWKDVLKMKENIYGSDLSFLTPEAIAYYLPAFMIYTIEYPNEADNLLDDYNVPTKKNQSQTRKSVNLYKILEKSDEQETKNLYTGV
jgi:hypothetical protein